MNQQQDNSNISDGAFILGVGILLAYGLWNRILPRIPFWLREPESRFVLFTVFVGLFTPALCWLSGRIASWHKKMKSKNAVIAKDDGSVFCGVTDKGEAVYIKTKQRAMHTQVIGTTNAGKTESVILPWAIQDIEQGRGLILIDGKADRSLLDKLWAYTVKAGREKDFRLFSLSSLDESHQFNPLLGGSPEEVAERVFNAFDFENEYFRSVQYEVFSQALRIFDQSHETPTFLKVFEAISHPQKMKTLANRTGDESLKAWASYYAGLPAQEIAQRTSGLTAALSHFAFGKTAALFNTENPSIDLDVALKQNLIIYFQLPVLLSPFLGRASGKMILQCLQSAVANRHRGENRTHTFFSVFLDDFAEYLYEGFVTILNKSRSANVGIVFAHQALGDIKTMGDAVANSILTNANLKVFMRGNDPESAEYFSKVIGTAKSVKYTNQTVRGIWQQSETGAASAREVDEFIVHPNRFKNELGVGEAVMVIPHDAGSRTINIKFKKYDDIQIDAKIAKTEKVLSQGLQLPETVTPPKTGDMNVESKNANRF
ncbi:MAG: type IV secretory system conjugative DNA transfer family protein [Bdellovibrionales bacterium]